MKRVHTFAFASFGLNSFFFFFLLSPQGESIVLLVWCNDAYVSLIVLGVFQKCNCWFCVDFLLVIMTFIFLVFLYKELGQLPGYRVSPFKITYCVIGTSFEQIIFKFNFYNSVLFLKFMLHKPLQLRFCDVQLFLV